MVPKRDDIVINNRETQSDFVRVVAMLFVICVHLPFGFTDNPLILIAQPAIFFTCNGMFYMLSGKFNLRFQPSDDLISSYKIYYLKKFKNILIPYFLYSIILYMYSNWHIYSELGLKKYIYGLVNTFFSANANGHIWFMYPLIGMLIGAPFLAKMLRSLSDQELKILVVIALLWNFVGIIIVRNIFMISYSYSGWFLNEWLFYFILGYCCDRLIDKKNGIYIILGFIAMLLTLFQKVYFDNRSQYIFDISPIYTFAIIGIYLFIERKCIVKNKKFKWVLSFLSKYSFGIYMLHMNVLNFVTGKMGNADGIVKWMIEVAIILAISLALTFIIDNCIIKPIKKLIII